MRSFILTVILVVVSFVFLISHFYYIDLNMRGYDILLTSKEQSSSYYGINYKRGFELWKTWRAGYGGMTEKKIFPIGLKKVR